MKIYMPSVFPTATISAITDKVIPELKQAAAPAEKFIPFVWLDAIHCKSPGGWPLPEQGRSRCWR
ncbi:hypothetical protein KCP69_11590 [Salmonella enterica subsp. enterica]|nr:hypothetical protein KCP69_11590 [Salmonella enterica subsp. enterica]